MKKLLLLVMMVSLANGRSLAQGAADTVVVVPIKTAPPQGAIKKGSLKEGNNATKTHCDYEEIVTEAKLQAAAMGGNVVKITELVAPALISKCYKIKADVYYASAFRDSVVSVLRASHSQQAADRPHATLYIYRLKDTVALATAYFLHTDDDSVITKVKSGAAKSVNIYKQGQVSLWAKTEARRDLKLDVKQGQEYYVRCGLVKGSLRNVPVLELVDKQIGEAEFSHLKTTTKNMDARYLQEVH